MLNIDFINAQGQSVNANATQQSPFWLHYDYKNKETASWIQQTDLFNETNDVNNMRIDEAMSVIRIRFVQYRVGRAIMLMDPSLSSFYPKTEHVIHPIAYLKSGIK